LALIWEWNATTYNLRHADEYRAFLKSRADALADSRLLAKPVRGKPQYSYISLRRSRSGHGHVAVFTIENEQVFVVRFFHTAEDWENKL